MATSGFLLYLLSASSIAVLSVLYFSPLSSSSSSSSPSSNVLSASLSVAKTWPDLELSWRLVAATVIGFLGSACGTVGGVGGGGIFVPMLTLIIGFDTKSAAAISKCMIMGASTSSVWYNLRVSHPTKNVPIIDHDLALLFQPMLMLGITIGVALSVVFPYWLITVLIIILFIGTSSRSFFKGIEMWKEETILKKEFAKQSKAVVNSRGELLMDMYEPLIPKEQKTVLELMCFNLRWKRTSILLVVWISFLILQVVKNDLAVCSNWYWIIFTLQFPAAFAVYGYEARKLYKEHKKRMEAGNLEHICEASIGWTATHLGFCALCGIVGGTVGGLLGSGGGFVLGPLLLEIGVVPQVASATATFVMMFSSSLSVVEFYLLHRFPIPYALYLTSVSVLAGFWGQFFVRKMIAILKRASLIVFILSGVICASAITMGIIGVSKSMEMIQKHEFMGFLDFCSNE